MSACRDALAALKRDGVESWRGLPTGCAPDELGLTDLDPSPGMADLGLRKAFFRSGRLDGTEVQVWTTTDEREVLMIAIAQPSFGVEGLGEPEARLDSARGTVPLPASEWVYAGRGLAAFVDPDGVVWRATLFRSSTLAEYENEFRVDLLERRLPRR
jgi:hypothetical protein